MKYFHQSEWDIKWNMTWENYMLYISSIPKYDEDDQKVDKDGNPIRLDANGKPMKVVNIADWF